MKTYSAVLIFFISYSNTVHPSLQVIDGPYKRIEKSVEMNENNAGLKRIERSRNTSKERQVCSGNFEWPDSTVGLINWLGRVKFLSVYPQQPDFPDLPRDQPTTCPGGNGFVGSTSGSWWPSHTENLRSTCPWIYEYVDFGETIYPRYIRQAVPLCGACVHSNVNTCKAVRQNITVFQRGACKGGMAFMTALTKSVVVGYHCTGNPKHYDGRGPVATD
ncbi:hypothetical protein Btru_048160 [Bulinus truncatus]|nr:hypothetical protein Btru_048160 [Bulinus truncatus]